MTTQAAIATAGLTKHYPGVRALDGLTLEVPADRSIFEVLREAGVGVLQANIDYYGLEPEISVPVHGDVAPIEQKFWEQFCDLLDLPVEWKSRGDWAASGMDFGSGDAHAARPRVLARRQHGYLGPRVRPGRMGRASARPGVYHRSALPEAHVLRRAGVVLPGGARPYGLYRRAGGCLAGIAGRGVHRQCRSRSSRLTQRSRRA